MLQLVRILAIRRFAGSGAFSVNWRKPSKAFLSRPVHCGRALAGLAAAAACVTQASFLPGHFCNAGEGALLNKALERRISCSSYFNAGDPMNLQEQEQLTAFLQQLDKAQAGYKDAHAQAMIADVFARQPDAAYLVVQRALLLDVACKNADAQIAQFNDQLARARTHAAPVPGFLDATTWGRQEVSAPLRPATAAKAPPLTYWAAAPLAAPAAARGFQAPSFLSGMAGTAAGVAAGAFLFQGISHLVEGGRHSAVSSASSTDLPAAGNERPASSHLLETPVDAGSEVADNNTAGFSELLDIGPDDSGDST